MIHSPAFALSRESVEEDLFRIYRDGDDSQSGSGKGVGADAPAFSAAHPLVGFTSCKLATE